MDATDPTPYGSADDLPTLRTMAEQIRSFKLLQAFMTREQRAELKRLEGKRTRIVDVVDRFYDLLGARHWVFTGDLNVEAMVQLVETGSTERAEEALLDYYQDEKRLRFHVGRMQRFAGMRPRRSLVEMALTDYFAGRYYSCVLVLLVVMDGFVNDVDVQDRRGLHAREARDMFAWDKVAGHHLGLTNAHRSFTKSFFKTSETEVTDLHRNGILHGTLVNFDNRVIATKAFNRLLAVGDWAEAREEAGGGQTSTPTLSEALDRYREVQERRRVIDEWQPHDHDAQSGGEVEVACATFLEQWETQRWGLLGAHFIQFSSTPPSVGALAQEAKALYAAHRLESWSITRVRHVGAGAVEVDCHLHWNGMDQEATLRWLRVDHAGNLVPEFEEGRWLVSPTYPESFLREARSHGAG